MAALLVIVVKAAGSCHDAIKTCGDDKKCQPLFFDEVSKCKSERKAKTCKAGGPCDKATKKLLSHPKGRAFKGCKCPSYLQPECGEIVRILDLCAKSDSGSGK